MYQQFNQDNCLIVGFPALVKASVSAKGDRLIEMECSNSFEDTEGDVILQKALLDAAPTYIKVGHIDIDHYSELGKKPEYAFLGIKNPDEWIIGVPLEVKDLGNGRTALKSQIFKTKIGQNSDTKPKYDMFWDSLHTDPPARWYASIYGYPGSDTEENSSIASRYLVKSFDWRSTAVTRNPINDSLQSQVKIVTAKSFAAKLLRPFPADERVVTREAIRKSFTEHIIKNCPSTDNGRNINVWTIRDHYMKCDCLTYNLADLCALATSELANRGKLY